MSMSEWVLVEQLERLLEGNRNLIYGCCAVFVALVVIDWRLAQIEAMSRHAMQLAHKQLDALKPPAAPSEAKPASGAS